MNLLSVSKLSKIGREATLLVNITFGFEEGEKAALIGKNGSGKSTLLNCLTGFVTPDAGTVVTNREAVVSFLPQNPVFEAQDTIRDHIFKSDSPKLRIIREYDTVCERIAEQESLHRRLEELTHEMDSQNLWTYENRIKSILTTLGINHMDLVIGTLSGGMIKKVALA